MHHLLKKVSHDRIAGAMNSTVSLIVTSIFALFVSAALAAPPTTESTTHPAR
jgi:hypothetical protein